MFEKFKKNNKKINLPSEEKNSTGSDNLRNLNKNHVEEKEYITDNYAESMQRTIYLWGWDADGNPGFLQLFGEQQLADPAREKSRLKDEVTYSCYRISCGKGGHFPSFNPVSIVKEYRSDNKYLYYKSDLNRHGSWRVNEKQRLDLKHFKKNDLLVLPYFKALSQKDCLEQIKPKDAKLNGFRIAEYAEEVMSLEDSLNIYADDLYSLFGNEKLYSRKKSLSKILDTEPPNSLLNYILDHGSSEVISGLLLELAKRNRDILLHEAENILNSNITWTEEHYASGIKRCAKIYIDHFNEDAETKRIAEIRSDISGMDQHLVRTGKTVILDKYKLTGMDYSKYYYQDLLNEYTYVFNPINKKYERKRNDDIYKKNKYSDGILINVNAVKDTIQQCEIYNQADLLGQIAYYMDAPRNVYAFRATNGAKALQYFRKYLRRVIDKYASEDEECFVLAMKTLFLNYNENDCLGFNKDDFSHNYFIKKFLYSALNLEIPDDWYEAYLFRTRDNFALAEGRFEKYPDIWNKNPDAVVEIMMKSKVIDVVKAFYYIFEDMDNKDEIVNSWDYTQLISLAQSPYLPISTKYMELLRNRLSQEEYFSIDILHSLINSDNAEIRKIALHYCEESEGNFKPEELLSFAFMTEIENWSALMEQGLRNLSTDEYLKFLSLFFENSDRFVDYSEEYIDELQKHLSASIEKCRTLSVEEHAKLFSFLCRQLSEEKKLPAIHMQFAEELLFYPSYRDLTIIMAFMDSSEYKNAKSATAQRAFTLLNSITNTLIPSDIFIMDVLNSASSNAMRSLVMHISNNCDELRDRYSTLLIFLESNVVALNEIAQNIFIEMDGDEQKQLHAIILDSPVDRAYNFAIAQLRMLYEDKNTLIPGDLLLRLLEHPAYEVRAYISDKLKSIIENYESAEAEKFFYYAKTLLFLPNKVAKSKNDIYALLPSFVEKNPDYYAAVDELLLELGNSNVRIQSEKALVTLAKLRMGVQRIESTI